MPSINWVWESISNRIDQLEAQLIEEENLIRIPQGTSLFRIKEYREYPEQIQHCTYCHNEFISDSRGACNSCGAPRSER